MRERLSWSRLLIQLRISFLPTKYALSIIPILDAIFKFKRTEKEQLRRTITPAKEKGVCLFLNKRGEDSGGEISGEGFKFKTEFWFWFFLLYIFEKKIGNRRKGRGLNEWWRMENQWAKPNPTQPYQRREREEL